MQLLFLDESGDVPKPHNKHQNCFVIGGIIIPEDYWHKVNDDLKAIKKQFNVNGEIKWRYFSPHNTDEGNALLHLPSSEREALRTALFGIITAYDSIRLVGAVASVKAAYEESTIDTPADLYYHTYKTLAEHFHYYLQDLSRVAGLKINGIIVCDHRAPKDDTRLRNLHDALLNEETSHFATHPHLVEGLFMSPSHLSVGIQLADMVAGAVFRHYESQDGRFFSQIKKSFHRVIEFPGCLKKGDAELREIP